MRTRGQAVALGAVRALLDGAVPHAVLFVGPPGTGKATLARDLAVGLLCSSTSPGDRPCGACRGCRMVRSGNHPDVHVLAPQGAGGQIRIGERTNPEPGTVRRLVTDLSLLPVEGGARVAIIEQADRMNEEAQSALLKTLEEPGAGVSILLCADQEERLLPTVRSRCARIRLGPVPVREMEGFLEEHGIEPRVGARLARLSGGRPGIALAWAAAPASLVARGELARTLLDLLGAGRAARLTSIARLQTLAAEVVAGVRAAEGAATTPAAVPGGRGGSRRRGTVRAEPAEAAGADVPEAGGKVPAAERRRAALLLLEVWQELTRDLVSVGRGAEGRLRDPELLEELREVATRVEPAEAVTFLERLVRAAELLESNVSPELVLDSLVLAWPVTPRVA